MDTPKFGETQPDADPLTRAALASVASGRKLVVRGSESAFDLVEPGQVFEQLEILVSYQSSLTVDDNTFSTTLHWCFSAQGASLC
jgi:hypothetical protein